jgi:hypothetical protein
MQQTERHLLCDNEVPSSEISNVFDWNADDNSF